MKISLSTSCSVFPRVHRPRSIGILSSCVVTDVSESSVSSESFSEDDSMKIAATVHLIVKTLDSSWDTTTYQTSSIEHKIAKIKCLRDNQVSSISDLQEKLSQEFENLIENPALINSDTLSLYMQIILIELDILSKNGNHSYYNLPTDKALKKLKNRLFFFLPNPTQEQTLKIINGVINELINNIDKDIGFMQYGIAIDTTSN